MMSLTTKWDNAILSIRRHRIDNEYSFTADLKCLWDCGMVSMGIHISNFTNSLFYNIIEEYSKEYRKYHNIRHLVDCFCEFTDVRHLVSSAGSMVISIFYHDIIYEIGSKSNERLSYERMSNNFRRLLTPNCIRKIELLIGSTTHNQSPESSDCRYMSDIDLCSLGVDKQTFKRYSEYIRVEYQSVSDDDFNKGRSIILTDLLNRGFIYQTLVFKHKYESRAVSNLNFAIRDLKYEDKTRVC